MRRFKKTKPAKKGDAYRQIWRLVDGAVRDTILHHPEYFRDSRLTDLRHSLAKRISGAIVGHQFEKLRRKPRGRSGQPAANKADAV